MNYGTSNQTISIGAALGSLSPGDEVDYLSARGLNIRVLPANGGTIVSVRRERDIVGEADLYVIGESQDLGTEIGKIITMNFLKK